MKLTCSNCNAVSDVAALVELNGQFGFICRDCGAHNTVELGGTTPLESRGIVPVTDDVTHDEDHPLEPIHRPVEPDLNPPSQKCPKCGYDNPLNVRACHRCGLNFAYASRQGYSHSRDGLVGNPAADALRERWARLKDDLDNVQGHGEFIQLCAMNGALQYAGTRYRELGDADPEDDRIATYRDRVIAAALAHSGRLETRAKDMVNNRLRSLLVLLFGALVLLGFAIGYYLLTGSQNFWQNH